MLAASGDEADVALAALQRPDQRSGDLFFGQRFGLFLLGPAVDHDLAVGAHSGGLHDLRLLVRIDVGYF